jgi:hypothetical protein
MWSVRESLGLLASEDSVHNYLWLKSCLEIQIWNWADTDSFKGSLNMQRKICYFHQPRYSVTKITLLHALLESHNAKINVLILSPNGGERYIHLSKNIFTIKCSDIKNMSEIHLITWTQRNDFFPNKVMEPSYNTSCRNRSRLSARQKIPSIQDSFVRP